VVVVIVVVVVVVVLVIVIVVALAVAEAVAVVVVAVVVVVVVVVVATKNKKNCGENYIAYFPSNISVYIIRFGRIINYYLHISETSLSRTTYLSLAKIPTAFKVSDIISKLPPSQHFQLFNLRSQFNPTLAVRHVIFPNWHRFQ
jgi:hypothetical protein